MKMTTEQKEKWEQMLSYSREPFSWFLDDDQEDDRTAAERVAEDALQEPASQRMAGQPAHDPRGGRK